MSCEARQFSDQMSCNKCSIGWDMNDPYPPECPNERVVLLKTTRGKTMFQEKIRDLIHAINKTAKLQQDFDKYKAKVARRERRWASVVSGYRTRCQELRDSLDAKLINLATAERQLDEAESTVAKLEDEVEFVKHVLVQAKGMLEDRQRRIDILKLCILLALVSDFTLGRITA